MPTTNKLRDSISISSSMAKGWFEGAATRIERKDFEPRSRYRDTGKGAVYVYYDKDHNPLYVGQTGRRIKARMHDQTSPHKHSPWWNKWCTMRFVQIENYPMDRLVLEFLLILAYQPRCNRKPGAVNINELFSKVIHVQNH